MARQDPQAGTDPEEDRGWPVWGAAIQDALDRRNITVNSAAGRL